MSIMKTLEKTKQKKGISPVIATIIIVAVAIAISIAVASWLMGLWTGFTATESLKVVSATAYSEPRSGSVAAGFPEGSEAVKKGCNVTIWVKIRNDGSAAAEIDSVYVNNLYKAHVDKDAWDNANETKPVEMSDAWVLLDENGNWADSVNPNGGMAWLAINASGLNVGQVIQIRIVTKAGTSLQQTITVTP